MLAQNEFNIKKKLDGEKIDSSRGKPKALFKYVEWNRRMPNAKKTKKKQETVQSNVKKPFSENFIPFIQERGKTGRIFDQSLIAERLLKRGASVSNPSS